MLHEFGRYLEKYWNAKIEKDGAEYRFNCPECRDTKKHFSVNVVRGVSNCFKCGYNPKPLEFLTSKGGLSYEDAIAMLRQGHVAVKKSETIEKVELPVGYEPVLNLVGGMKELFYAWLKERGMSWEDAVSLRFGVVTDKTSNYFGRVIIPVIEDCKVVYWTARAMLFSVEPKYLMAPAKKRDFIWGIDHIQYQHEEVIITEGWQDAFKVGGVAIFGKFISHNQLTKIESRLVNGAGIGVMLDRDAFKEGVKLAEMVWKYTKVRNVRLYNIVNYKDPGMCKHRLEAIQGSDIYNFSKIEDRVKAKLYIGKLGR